MSPMRAFALSLALAALLALVTFLLLSPLELGHPGMLIPVAVITLIAGVPYAIAEVRRSDRESRAPRR
jgi:uncharacterized RDD family membrane protein YckC